MNNNESIHELEAIANRANRSGAEIFGHGYNPINALKAMAEDNDDRTIYELAKEIDEGEKNL